MMRGEQSCKLVVRDPLGNISIECEEETKVQIDDFVRSRDDCNELGVPYDVRVVRPKGGWRDSNNKETSLPNYKSWLVSNRHCQL